MQKKRDNWSKPRPSERSDRIPRTSPALKPWDLRWVQGELKGIPLVGCLPIKIPTVWVGRQGYRKQVEPNHLRPYPSQISNLSKVSTVQLLGVDPVHSNGFCGLPGAWSLESIVGANEASSCVLRLTSPRFLPTAGC